MRTTLVVMAVAASLGFGSTANAYDMRTGGRASQPIGHWELCRSIPAECSTRTRRRSAVALTPKVMGVLQRVNAEVNRRVRPMTDWAHHGVEERWSYPAGIGDCEDYVLAKRRALMRHGFAAGGLLVTVVKQPNGEGHAVLSVRTNRGEYILDNVDQRVRHWSETPYRYVKRQSTRHAGTWVTIRDRRSRLAMR